MKLEQRQSLERSFGSRPIRRSPRTPVPHKAGGFTLIELVVVIVILGILAAFAIPRFININREAREAALKGLGGSVRSTVALVHGMALARGLTAASGQSVVLEGHTVTLAFGYPTADAAGIVEAISNLDGFTQTLAGGPPAQVTWIPVNPPANTANCQVVYQEAASAVAPATVTTPPPATLDCT